MIADEKPDRFKAKPYYPYKHNYRSRQNLVRTSIRLLTIFFISVSLSILLGHLVGFNFSNHFPFRRRQTTPVSSWDSLSTYEDIFEIQSRYDGPTSVESLPLSTKTNPMLPMKDARDLCDRLGLKVFQPRQWHRKVYDLFLLGSELDWLEIRLNELWEEVDYFVIVESTRTFTYHPKPLILKEYLDRHAQDPRKPNRFAKFIPKIIYRVVTMEHLPPSAGFTAWDRENFQRDSLFISVFPSLIGHQAARYGDVLLLSDADELARPAAVQILRNCEFPDRYTLHTKLYYYSFQWHQVLNNPDGGGWTDWFHPQATSFRGLNHTVLPSILRDPVGTRYMENAGWHCSTCFRTLTETIHKIASFSHTAYNIPRFTDAKDIIRRIREGRDLYDRKTNVLERVDNNPDVPEYVRQNPKRFGFLLDRDGKEAAFEDYLLFFPEEGMDVAGMDSMDGAGMNVMDDGTQAPKS